MPKKLILITASVFVVGLASGYLMKKTPNAEANTQSLTNSVKANEKVHWKIAQSWQKNLPVFSPSVERMVSLVDELSDGNFKITIHDKNKHKAPLAIFDMVKDGLYEMGHSASYYWKGKVPNTLFFTTLPFGLNSMEQYAWFYHGGGLKLMNEVYEPHNLVSFLGGNTGSQMAGWYQKEIKTTQDFKGLKIRIPGFAGEVMKEVGANPENIPAGDLYTALDRKTIDAVEWMGPSLDVPMGFHKIATYYYTGWNEPSSELQYLVNKQAFDKLSPKYQQILQTAIKVAAFEMYVHATHENIVKLEEIKKDFPHVKIKTFPKEVVKDLYQATQKLLAQRAKSDSQAKRILASRKAYLSKAREWTLTSEYEYLSTVKAIETTK